MKNPKLTKIPNNKTLDSLPVYVLLFCWRPEEGGGRWRTRRRDSTDRSKFAREEENEKMRRASSK